METRRTPGRAADTRVVQAEQVATRARQAEAAAIVRADHAQAAAADETARIRADHQHALDQLATATNARITALEERATPCAFAPNGQKPTLTWRGPKSRAWPDSSTSQPAPEPTRPAAQPDSATMQVYTQVPDKTTRDALERLSDLLGGPQKRHRGAHREFPAVTRLARAPRTGPQTAAKRLDWCRVSDVKAS